LKGEVGCSEQLFADRLGPQAAAQGLTQPCQISEVTTHKQLPLAGVISILSTEKSREKEGVASNSKILLSVPDIHTGAWFTTDKSVTQVWKMNQ